MEERHPGAMPDSARGHQGLCWRPWPCPKCNAGLSPIGFLVRGSGASPNILQREPEEIASIQVGLLRGWIDSCPHHADLTLALPQIAQGSEHTVFLSEDGSDVYKRTLPGTFGESYYLSDALVCQRNCSPLDYLIRLRLWKKVFGSAPEALGLTAAGQVVSQQKFIFGIKPSQSDLEVFLLESKMAPVRQDCFLWRRQYPNYEIWLGDARDENFVKTTAGIVPIDVRMWFASKIQPGFLSR